MASPRSRRTDLRTGGIDFANSNWQTHTFTTNEKASWGAGTYVITLQDLVAQDSTTDYLLDLFVNGIAVPKSKFSVSSTTLTIDNSFYQVDSSDEVYYNYIKAN